LTSGFTYINIQIIVHNISFGQVIACPKGFAEMLPKQIFKIQT
jgi:hypothetical protein